MNYKILSILAISLFFYAGYLFCAEAPIFCPKPSRPVQQGKMGYVILLLGSSSVGKTYIIGKLEQFLAQIKNLPEIVTIAMDSLDSDDDFGISGKLRNELPKDWHDEHITLYKKIIDQALNNKIVICDLMLFESPEEDITESFINKLKEKTNVFSTLVYCSMNQLIANITHRNQSADSLEQRRLISTVNLFCDMYLSSSPGREPIDCIPLNELGEAIRAVSASPVNENEKRRKDRCIMQLQGLHNSRTPSPILCQHNLYDYWLKNDANLADKIGNMFYALFAKLSSIYHTV